MNEKLVSIITPSFNSSAYITETIESVLGQSFQNWELLIVDDCSTDNSYTIVKEFEKKDNRIKVFKMETNSGCPAIPRNYALRESKGDYVAFLDSDDIWHNKKLEWQINIMIEDNISFTATELKIFHNFSEIKNLTNSINAKDTKLKKINHTKLMYKNIIPNSSVIVEKRLLDSLKFNEDLRYKAIEDYHMWLRILQNGGYCYKLNRELLFYRLADTSISKSKFSMLKKHFILYSEYEYGQKKLGLKIFVFICTYIYFSIINKIIKRKV
jgi:teichuronic acid biosynthesis glycosyltransferase TuaG